MSARARRTTAGAILVSAALTLSACAGGSAEEQGDEIVVTCATCQESPTDPFLQYNFEAATRFNEQFAGQYRIEMLNNANAGSSEDRLQYYQRLALADDLPDIFQLNSAEIAALSETGELHDFTGNLDADTAWAESFQPGSLDALTGDDGQVWAIPQQRDPIGTYWNTELWGSVGFDEFPTTWDAFEEGAAALAEQGELALALDGDWATMLTWTNLIGTQPGGVDFLTAEIAGGDWSSNEVVVAATERLRQWHVDGYVNSDAFSGDFSNAAAAYLSGDAATVPNGPWFVKTNLQTEAAAEGLYERTGYAVSPGWDDGQGIIVVSGAGWVSGATDDPSQEAVMAFMRFVTSPEEALTQAVETGANPAVVVPDADLESADLEPLSAGLVLAAAEAEFSYPHVRVFGPAGFGPAWKNLWPAYVNGEMDTGTFLSRLSADASAGS
ncbi:ABC transporter substrate-binding protein [Ruania alba]|uniref:ABC-type glycerol-3-phosphate transport system, substrate-binding protein n=1 Tax=Ruania alba TaxID=648782 RepID=A0A1H5GXQ9_9MICO|nr:extracellular solute-binding protein [Ruania alba]SEE20251.1 ABC-type glycerol-3-phosphate transport system, substrate-binding protein [Ruania alba]